MTQLPHPYVWKADICRTALGFVCHATDAENNIEVVVKVVNFSQFSQEEANAVAHEARVLMYLKHDHIVETYNVIIDPDTSTIFIIMEACLGTLGTAIQIMSAYGRQIPEDCIWHIAAEIGSALKYLHEPHEKTMLDWYSSEIPVGSVVHGYLTPSDIFISRDGKCKIGGISPTQSSWEIRSGRADLGRFFLQSPEVLDMQSFITEKVDIWSLGTTLFFLASFRSVWSSTDYPSVVNEIKGGKVQRLPDEYSQELDDFIGKCLQIESMYRPTILELLLGPRIEDALRAVRDGSVPSMLFLLGLSEDQAPAAPAQPESLVVDTMPPSEPATTVDASASSLNSPSGTGAPEGISQPRPEEAPDMATYVPPEQPANVATAELVVEDPACIEAAENTVNFIANEACAVPPAFEGESELVDMNILPDTVTMSVQEPQEETVAVAAMPIAELEVAPETYTVGVDVIHRIEDPSDSDLARGYSAEPALVDSVRRLEDPEPDYALIAETEVVTAEQVQEEVVCAPEPVVEALAEPAVAPVPVTTAAEPVLAAAVPVCQPLMQPIVAPAMGVTNLMTCVANGDVAGATNYLHEQGYSDSFGKTALMRAAEMGNAQLVRLLVEQENGQQDIDGWTALMFAVHSRNIDCVRILAPYEKGLTLRNGQTALIMAAFWDNPEAVVELAPHESRSRMTSMFFEGEGFTALMEAARWGRHRIVELLIPYEQDLRDARGMTALDYAQISNDSVNQSNKLKCITLLSKLSAF